IGESSLPLLDKYPNLLVMRTFSKAFGLAGMRVGYLLAGRDVVRELLRIKQPFNVNSFSQLAARSVLIFSAVFEKRIREIVRDRTSLEERMKKISGLKLYPTVTNFLLFSTSAPAGEVYRKLREAGVMVRYIGTRDRGDFLRVSVGTESENSVFIDKLESIIAI
ncbi:MAG: pyridoxal phosphate-dependent aminotransferase, partial [Desulfocucumaceae bacterium]